MISSITNWNQKFRILANAERTKEIAIVYDKGNKYESKIFRIPVPLDREKFCELETERYITTFIYNRIYAIGAKKIYIDSDDEIYEKVKKAFMKEDGKFYHVVPFLSKIYEEQFEICRASKEEIQQIISDRLVKKVYKGNPKSGRRIGLDMGGSDIKVVALENGNLKYYEKMNWNPRTFKKSSHHYQIIYKMINLAMDGANFKKLDGIGISTAGVVVDSEIKISGLFRLIDEYEFEQRVKPMNKIVSEKFGKIPVHVLHDGDATAIWTYFEMGLDNVLGLAFGTGLGAGYADESGNLAGYLCEIGKSVLDMSPNSPEHIYNHIHGPALHYLSQNAVFRLAKRAEIEIDRFDELAEKLRYVQKLAEDGEEKALAIFEMIGNYLAVAVVEFYNYFKMQNVVIFGRVTSGIAGEIILKNANQELRQKFPEFDSNIKIHLPSNPPGRDAEVSREFGQAIAAAYFSNMQES